MTIKDNGDGTFSVIAPCSFNKPKVTVTKYKDKVVAITMTDDDHRITEVLWEMPKPLSDDEIDKLADEYLSDYFNMQETINFVKAIEERHGIK